LAFAERLQLAPLAAPFGDRIRQHRRTQTIEAGAPMAPISKAIMNSKPVNCTASRAPGVLESDAAMQPLSIAEPIVRDRMSHPHRQHMATVEAYREGRAG
jgi:hypothetical protein